MCQACTSPSGGRFAIRPRSADAEFHMVLCPSCRARVSADPQFVVEGRPTAEPDPPDPHPFGPPSPSRR